MRFPWLLPLTVVLLRGCDVIDGETRIYYGQRIFADVRVIDSIDPTKHGFHILLRQDFIKEYLQSANLPTIYATAVAVEHQQRNHSNDGRQSGPGPGSGSGLVLVSAPVSASVSASVRDPIATTTAADRVTKVLHPERGDPEHGLLDGRKVKIIGLRERTWYSVCVEFESTVDRHQVATGIDCRLCRTLDKFGANVSRPIYDVQLLETDERSVTVGLLIDARYRQSINVYLSGNPAEVTAMVPAQTFVLQRPRRILTVTFSGLEPNTSYGRLCVLSTPTDITYSAMGRPIYVISEQCYLDNVTTSTRIRRTPEPLKSREIVVRQKYRGNNSSNSIRWSSSIIEMFLLQFVIYLLL